MYVYMYIYIYVLHVICLLATLVYVGDFFFSFFLPPPPPLPPNYIGFYSRKNYEGFVIGVLFGCNSLNVWQWQWESWIPQIGGTLYWVSDVWTHFCLFCLCCILHISFFFQRFPSAANSLFCPSAANSLVDPSSVMLKERMEHRNIILWGLSGMCFRIFGGFVIAELM